MKNSLTEGNGLNERQKRFAELRLAQPYTSIAQLYVDAGYKAKNGNTANAAASRLLHNVKIIEYMFTLRRAARAVVVGKAASWQQMQLDSRDYVEGVISGRYPPDSERLKAAIYATDRVEGKPKQSVDVRQGTLGDALRELDDLELETVH